MSVATQTKGDAFYPSAWDDYIGQEHIKAQLRVRVVGALQQERPLPHMALIATPGAGKTSLVHLIAEAVGDPMVEVQSLTLDDLRFFVQNHRGILFIDEFHRLAKGLQEDFLSLLQFGYLESKRARRITADWLTVIVATTERDKVLRPVLQRFPIVPTFVAYTDDELARIALSMAAKAAVTVSDADAMLLGRASLGVPRNLRSLVLSCVDLSIDLGRPATGAEVLDFEQIDLDGLGVRHRALMEIVASQDGRCGERVLCQLLGVQPSELFEIEKVLLERGLLEIAPGAGRRLTAAGYARIEYGTVGMPSSPRRRMVEGTE